MTNLSQELMEEVVGLSNELMQVQLTQQIDQLRWVRGKEGKYTVASAYNFLQARPIIQPVDINLWKLSMPTRVTVFQWLRF